MLALVHYERERERERGRWRNGEHPESFWARLPSIPLAEEHTFGTTKSILLLLTSRGVSQPPPFPQDKTPVIEVNGEKQYGAIPEPALSLLERRHNEGKSTVSWRCKILCSNYYKEQTWGCSATNVAGAKMVPVNWQEMMCPLTNQKEPCKVAKVV
ncbi:hypothetical protein L7F22_040524 [Adiantum nelumboides]|nr:hypothetical protein [Adiantum nelumboides]